MKTQIANVVMLSTKKSKLVEVIDSIMRTAALRYDTIEHEEDLEITPQHLYFTSNEEIKEGDWYRTKTFDEMDKKFIQATKENTDFSVIDPYSQKIIATTDTSLWQHASHPEGTVKVGLPSISQSFIKQYVEANGDIDKVELEYEQNCKMNQRCIWLEDTDGKKKEQCCLFLKITDNNEVIIK